MNATLIRLLDILLALTAIIILAPLFLVLALSILAIDGRPILFRQTRVGQFNIDITVLKFRTMTFSKESSSALTLGNNDPRIFRGAATLRNYKLDELPQLVNILKGDMSLVGPRPEVRKFVNLYSDDQKKVLNVKPGLTDHASLYYFNEDELLGDSNDAEFTYINEIMPEKIRMNMAWVNNPSLYIYMKLILSTLIKIIFISRDH